MNPKWRTTIALTLAVVVTAFGVLFFRTKFLRCPHYGHALLQKVLLQGDSSGPKEFKWLMSYTAAPPNGSTGSSAIDGQVYQASDCVEVANENYVFTSPGAAEQEVQRRLRTDYRVYEHTKRADGTGVFERAVTQAQAREQYFILRRRGNKITAIISESLPHALAYERMQAPQEPGVQGLP